jgi:hypothetical protein
LPNLLVQVEGEVWLRRVGWSDFLPAGFGVAVEPGDLLRVTEGSVAAVFCGDESLWEASPKPLPADEVEHSAPCQTGRPPRPWPDVAALRGEEDGHVPYVVHPRDTALLSDRPRLRWHPLPGVDTYTVTVIGDDGQDRSPVQVTGEGTDWPTDWPPLEHGATYVLIVEGEGQRSDEGNETHAGLGFWMLPTGEAEEVQTQAARLRARPLSPAAVDMLTAALYVGRGLRAEAVELLEGLSARDASSTVWLALGQIHLETGLALEAEEAFGEASAAAQRAGDLETEATACVGLGLAARLSDDEAKAKEHLQTARTLYEQIGDQNGVEEADRLLTW